MVMLIILIMGSAVFLVNSLGRPGRQIERDQITSNALSQARNALIAYAINSENNASETQPRPGNLPCPDTDAPGANGYGDEEGSCAAGAIGRLPWKSLGIPELVDSDGEPLWYAVSGNFRRRSTNSNPLNSDTTGTLDVYANDGTTLLTPGPDRAVAVIFAPGRIVGSQQRSTSSDKTTASNYLEAGPGSRNNANTGGPFITADKSDSFNDKLAIIKVSQLLPAVEKRVAGELRNHLKSYYASWNAFPFAAPFSDPSASPYMGSASPAAYYGLYPFGGINVIGSQPPLPTWNAAPFVMTVGGAISGSMSCILSSGGAVNSRWRCCDTGGGTSCTSNNFTIPGGVIVNIVGRLNDVGRGFWKLHDINDINVVRVRNSSGVNVLAGTLLDNVSVTGTLSYADGSASVVFSAKGKPGGSVLQRIELRDIQYQSAPLPSWFAVNNWNQVVYYAVSQGYAPGGNHTCSPSCLMLDNSAASAVIVATGATLDSVNKPRPSGSFTNYLEGRNAIPASGIYENKTLASDFNDKVISVSQ